MAEPKWAGTAATAVSNFTSFTKQKEILSISYSDV